MSAAEKPTIKNAVKHEMDDLADIGKTIVARTPARAIGIAVVVAVIFAGIAGLFYLSRDTIVKVLETQADVKHLQSEHAHCHEELTEMKAEVKALRDKLERLESRLADN